MMKYLRVRHQVLVFNGGIVVRLTNTWLRVVVTGSQMYVSRSMGVNGAILKRWLRSFLRDSSGYVGFARDTGRHVGVLGQIAAALLVIYYKTTKVQQL